MDGSGVNLIPCKKSMYKCNLQKQIDIGPYPWIVNEINIPNAQIKLAMMSRLNNLEFLICPPKLNTIRVNNVCVTQPEKAKWECACNRYFWLKKGNSNPILYLIKAPITATMVRLMIDIRIKKSFMIGIILKEYFMFSNFYFAIFFHFYDSSDDGLNPQS
jgi:hypothetical protein